MASKELRKLKRRELLKMLLVQCQETERLQQEMLELRKEHEEMSESYERLKTKLNVKDERLNRKDVQIKELQNKINKMKTSREIELEEAGSIAEAALRLNGVFEAAQQAAEQYLMNVRKAAGKSLTAQELEEIEKSLAEDKRIPIEAGWRAGIRRRGTSFGVRTAGAGYGNREITAAGGEERRVLAAVSGETHG